MTGYTENILEAACYSRLALLSWLGWTPSPFCDNSCHASRDFQFRTNQSKKNGLAT